MMQQAQQCAMWDFKTLGLQHARGGRALWLVSEEFDLIKPDLTSPH